MTKATADLQAHHTKHDDRGPGIAADQLADFGMRLENSLGSGGVRLIVG